MKKLYEQFVRERRYLKNVTPKTEAWYWQAWHALACGLPEDETVPPKAYWTDRVAAVLARRGGGQSGSSPPSQAQRTWRSM
jgi:hypothetical protein